MVKVGTSRFGLVIDRIVGTEEIVVKPMHRVLKELPIFSGATVLGDGHVALILDIPAIARHGGFQMDDREDDTCCCGSGKPQDAAPGDVRRLLLFRNRPDEHLALPLEKVSRIEHVDVSSLERIGEREYLTIHGVSTRALRLDHYLDLAPSPEKPTMFAIIPKAARQPFCILVPELVDSGEYRFHEGAASYRHPCVEAAGLVDDVLTVVVRPEAVARMAEPGWFAECCA